MIYIFATNTTRKLWLAILLNLEFRVRGVRKFTTGIASLWQPSDSSDVTFLFLYVASSYHRDAEVTKAMMLTRKREHELGLDGCLVLPHR